MKLGGDNISNVFLGSTEVTKAYLGDVMVHGSALPYDAEVEWLQSTGTQRINIPITGATKNTYFCVYAEIMPLYETPGSSRRYVMATNPTNQWSMYYYSRNTSTGLIVYASTVGGNSSGGGLSLPENTKCFFELATDHKDANGTVTSMNRQLTTTLSSFNVFNSHDTTAKGFPIKLYSMQITVGTTLQHDLIPVRKGTVGYLYDKISGKLFENVGTGDFVLGNDVS